MKKIMLLFVVASLFTACSKDDEILANLDKLNQTGFTEVSIYFDSSVKSVPSGWGIGDNVIAVFAPLTENSWGDYIAYTAVSEIDVLIPLTVLLQTNKQAILSNSNAAGNGRNMDCNFTPIGKKQVYKCYFVDEGFGNQYLKLSLISQEN